MSAAARPRFWDAHTHLSAGAADLLALDLRSLTSAGQIVAALARAAGVTPEGAWIRAWGWEGATPPADVSPRHPVVLSRRDGHAGWLNAAARAALGLAGAGSIVEEGAYEAVRASLPEHTSGERLAAMGPRLDELVGLGVAAVDDMVEPWAPELYALLRDRGELPVAVGMWLPETIGETEAEAVRRACPADDRRLATRGIKLFLDGTLRARTAALSQPYADDPGNLGILRGGEREILERVSRWASRGWAVAVHAIGDRAVGLALDAFESAPRPAVGSHRIEHAQVVRRADLPRFSAAGVIASVQPGHWRDDREFIASCLGDRPGVVAYPLRSFASHGAMMAFGSDWPVSAWDPKGILAAASDPKRGDEALDAAPAAAWYTSRPPWPTPSSSKGSSSTASTA